MEIAMKESDKDMDQRVVKCMHGNTKANIHKTNALLSTLEQKYVV